MELSLEAQRVRKELIRTYGDTPDLRRLAEVAALSWQRAEEASALVQAEGMTLTTGHGTVAHPAVTIERVSRLAYLSAVRALRQEPRHTKIGRPAKTDRAAAWLDRTTKRFFGADDARASKTAKYLRSTSRKASPGGYRDSAPTPQNAS